MAATALAMALAFVATTTMPAAAQSPEVESHLFDRVSLVLGFGWTGSDTDMRLDSTRFARVGTEISFEKDLGLSSSEAIPAVQLEWMVDRRHMLAAV
jgi:hypothetical protein